MSRQAEIVRRLSLQRPDTNSRLAIPDAEATELWPRFRKVHDAVVLALTGNQSSSVSRQLRTFDWTGYDSGTHDHEGKVKGVVNETGLDIKIKGVTFDDAQRIDVDEAGNWRVKRYKEQRMEIEGGFVSPDGRKGEVRILINNGLRVEAYWLQVSDGTYRLEQVINEEGKVFDVDKLETKNGSSITVPGANVGFPKLLED